MLHWMWLFPSPAATLTAKANPNLSSARGKTQERVFEVISASDFRTLLEQGQANVSVTRTSQSQSTTGIVALFYAHWCPHSQALSGALRGAAKVFEAAPDLQFVQLAEHHPANRPVFEEYDVTGVPELVLLLPAPVERQADSRDHMHKTHKIYKYDGNRTTVAVVKWIHEIRCAKAI